RHTRFSRDWSSDVCSSDLERDRTGEQPDEGVQGQQLGPGRVGDDRIDLLLAEQGGRLAERPGGDGLQTRPEGAALPGLLTPCREIGRASCRERVEDWGGAG